MLMAGGIPAFVENANSQTTLSHIGPAVGGVRLLVDGADADRAEELLALDLAGDESEPWYCTNCSHSVDAGFDICWKCGADRPSACTPDDISAMEESRVSYAAHPDELPSTPRFDRDNPYRATSSEQMFNPNTLCDTAEDTVRRAMIVAVVGIVILPGLAHGYSLYLLFRCWPQFSMISSRAGIQFAATLFLDIVAILGTAILILPSW